MIKQISAFLMVLLVTFDVQAENYWLNAEYLYWKIQDAKKVIPLVVEGPEVPDGTPVLDLPGYDIVLGDEHINSKWRSGGRFTFGFICGDMCEVGVEASYFFLGRSNTQKQVSSNGEIGSPFLTIPYINSNTRFESSFAIARPGLFNGTAKLNVTNTMQGAELYSLYPIPYLNGWTMEVFGGFRYLNFNERLQFNTESLFIDPGLNDIFFTRDHFHVDNNFYGGSLGANFIFQCHGLLFNLKAKIGAGAMLQSSKVRGLFETNNYTDFTLLQTFNGGYFALPSNSGVERRPRFSVIPEIEVNIGYEIVKNLSLHVGYNFLYVTNVLRASRQLDPYINPTGSPLYQEVPNPIQFGPSSPKKQMRSSDLWVQGLTAGIAYIF